MSSNKNDNFLSDFGVYSVEVLSNIATAPLANWKHNHYVPEKVIYDSIVLSASMFGAIFLFSVSLIGINRKWIKQQKAELSASEVFNGTIMFLSGGVIVFISNKALTKLFGK